MRNKTLEMLKEIKPGRSNGLPKPHKFALLLAIIRLYERQPNRENIFKINHELEKLFELEFRKLSPDTMYSSTMIEAPFYHLQSDGFWHLHIKPGKETNFNKIKYTKNNRFTKKRLLDVFSHASLNREIDLVFRKQKTRERAEQIIKETYHKFFYDYQSNGYESSSQEEVADTTNPFVSYLNSLQRSGGSNENALAESQACNAQFASIHVSHPLADTIYEELNRPNGRHVILTGHAGDGKSTIALEIYKRLSGFASDAPLEHPPRTREDVGAISIIKDLSERDRNQDSVLLDELIANERRFLLVSNTGTLLDLIKTHPGHFDGDSVSLESQVLDAISTESGEAILALSSTEFRVFNLARMDNLGLAREIFVKMLSPDRWTACAKCYLRERCPIQINVALLQSNQDRVVDRIFLAYRRMYEYGTRLTIRQFTEHLSYMVTAGLEEADIPSLQRTLPYPLITEYLFFNRFFGDNGCIPDDSAREMKAVQAVEKQGFGGRPSPRWEHRLWLHSEGPSIKLGVAVLDEEFDKLRRHGSHEPVHEYDRRVKDEQAREQVRRMLFFLYDFKPEDRNYLSQYLNSPTLLDWYDWQRPGVRLGFNDKTNLERKIYHVLQEHFTGVRLPEGSTQNDRRLYVTLSRRRSEVRQSAQIVLAQVDWSTSTALELLESKSASGVRRQDLVLCGKDRIDGVNLLLKVPFLDYVMMRHFGELGEVLEASYRERLDRFKAQVHERATATNDDRIMLVRLRTDHTFRRQHFSVNDGRLEVTNVL